jgi:CRISPR-associated protein Cmr6
MAQKKPVKLEEMQAQSNQNKDNSSQETAQNFYSFLHKQKRFDNDFKMYKINILKSREYTDDRGKKRIEETKLVEDFERLRGWQKTPFYQSFITRHYNNALQLTGGNLLPKVYDNKKKNDLQFQPDWRLAIGLGSGSVFETSISLHHIYGFPYIPASAVKGALRSYLITTLQGTEVNSEALLFHNSKEMCDIFGCGEETIYDENGQKKRMSTFYKRCFDEDKAKFGKDKSQYRFPEITEKIGDIIFFDAYPTHSPQCCIKADIMNNHYQPYYNGEAPPADYHKLNPIIFLTVEKLTFQFMVGLHKGVENINIKLGTKGGDMLSVVSDFLKDALTEKGIGAKTAVGYGYMKAS